MSLDHWLKIDWVRRHDPTAREVESLLAVVQRDVTSASIKQIDADNRFQIAYSAALTLAKVALYASGHAVPKGGRNHELTLESLTLTLGSHLTKTYHFLDICRRKRHQSMYDLVGVVTDSDAAELLKCVKELRGEVMAWLGRHHGELLPRDAR